ncbi:MAG: hemerythrin domain-containing protein [Pseudomonadota bacterium]
MKTNTDAIALLQQDHRDVEKAFKEFERKTKSEFVLKKKLADQIGNELLKHMTVEEEIFYPAIKEKVKGAEGMVNEAIVEHAVVRDLIKQIHSMKGNEELFHTKVMVLAELIGHHVKEEEDEMFPKVQKSTLDLPSLGEKIEQRKRQLK